MLQIILEAYAMSFLALNSKTVKFQNDFLVEEASATEIKETKEAELEFFKRH